MKLKSLSIRVIALAVILGCAIAAVYLLAFSPRANAMPDPYTPIPPLYCSGGGIQSPWGGYCGGATYPDGTHWHSANGMGFWMPAVCTFADGGTTPAPTGCGQR